MGNTETSPEASPSGPSAEVFWLGDPGSRDAGKVGGKVAHLSRLAVDFRVPPAFCLSTSPVDASDLSAGFRRVLADAYRTLGHRCGQADLPVAVRSSAVDEDSPTASFAGQHETFLNVVGLDALVDAVTACLASVVSERAREYRRHHLLSDTPSRAAVLVQQLVVADVSGVLFSLNPVTGERGEILLTVSWGLGQSVVGGRVTPDTYVVDRTDLGVIRKVIAEKRSMTVVVPRGVREVDVPSRMQRMPCVDERQLREMARVGLEVERRMGWPVDLELSWSDGALYVLQCRPVTAVGGQAVVTA
jgi:phosphoenolpyruvate synthase/pyruvate phosphate dikinase